MGRFSEIESTIRILTKAVEEYGITVLGAAPASESQLAEQLLEAVRVASQMTERKLSLIPCLRIPLTIDGVEVDDYRRWLSYYEVERKVDGKILERYLDDPILHAGKVGGRSFSMHRCTRPHIQLERLRGSRSTTRL